MLGKRFEQEESGRSPPILTFSHFKRRERGLRKKMMMIMERKNGFCEEFRGEKMVD